MNVAGTREHNSWRAMRERCYNKNSVAYKNYGARGISVCDRWKNSFKYFLNDMGRCPKGLTLERIDSNGNYEPSNCKWATRTDQARNRPGMARMLTYKGRTQHLVDWARELGIGVAALHNRIRIYGWSIEDALSTRKSNKWSRQPRRAYAQTVV